MKHWKFLVAGLSVVGVSAGVSYYCAKHVAPQERVIIERELPIRNVGMSDGNIGIDFTDAADKTVNAVVHVMTTYEVRQSAINDPFLQYFFGDRGFQQAPQQKQASGSGVILSKDGYIVTNNHVVEGSDEISVVLNDKRQFKATLVGADPSTDLALLKVEADDLPTIQIGNSDELRVGEWVLAVGNPFNLTSTVTAGIVSAKARNINILTADMKIESFIQTDAAVNPGNSGGALVNTRGELIGINAAIASKTGSYSGYSFAIPTTIMSKVVADLKEFGTVQRALLGIQIQDINAEFAKEKDLKVLEGAYVAEVGENSAADDAGIKKGDVIIKVENHKIKSVSELQEQISRYRPGDKVTIEILRGNDSHNYEVQLKNIEGNTQVVKSVDPELLGATLVPLSEKEKKQYGLKNGLVVKDVKRSGKFNEAGIPEGYIIVRINNQDVNSLADVNNIVKKTQNNSQDQALFISGILPNGKVVYYAVDMSN